MEQNKIHFEIEHRGQRVIGQGVISINLMIDIFKHKKLKIFWPSTIEELIKGKKVAISIPKTAYELRLDLMIAGGE